MTPVDYDKHIANIHNQGYTIVPGVLTPSECDTALDELERLSAQRARGGFECLFNKARIFERVYQVAPLLRLVRHFLGADAILSSAHGSILEPGAGGGDLHADGALAADHDRVVVGRHIGGAGLRRRPSGLRLRFDAVVTVDAHLGPVAADELELGAVLLDELVAVHARLRRGNRRDCCLFDRTVAIATVEAQVEKK